MTPILGWIALVITLLYTGLGLPSQVASNSRNKSTGSLSFLMTALMFLTFASWVLYSISKQDYFILVSNGIGCLFATWLLVQFWIYRGNQAESVASDECKTNEDS